MREDTGEGIRRIPSPGAVDEPVAARPSASGGNGGSPGSPSSVQGYGNTLEPDPIRAPAPDDSVVSGLFGRGLLYVVVGSLPLLTATVVSPVLAYQLGPRGLGLMASAIALHQVLLVLAMVGLEQALVVQRAEDQHDRSARGIVAAGIALAAGLTVVVGVTGPLWSRFLGFPGFGPLVVATVLWTAPAAGVQLAIALLMGQDRLRAFSIVTVLSTVGSQASGLVLLFFVSRTVEAYAWGGVAGQTVAMVLALLLVRPRWRGVLDTPVLTRALRLGVPLMLSSLSLLVLNSGDRLIILRLLGSDEAGRYQVAYTVGFIGVTVLTLTSQAWAARITAVRDPAERWNVIGRSRDELYAAFAPVALGVVLGAPLALRVLAPPSFRPESLLIVVLLIVLAGVPVVAGLSSARALVSARRPRPLAVGAGVAAVLNVLLNLLVVPLWGLAGAAAATTVAFTVQAVLQRVLLPAEPRWPRTPVRRQLLLLATCAGATASVFLPQDTMWIALRTVAGILCIPWLLLSLRRARRGPQTAS